MTTARARAAAVGLAAAAVLAALPPTAGAAPTAAPTATVTGQVVVVEHANLRASTADAAMRADHDPATMMAAQAARGAVPPSQTAALLVNGELVDVDRSVLARASAGETVAVTVTVTVPVPRSVVSAAAAGEPVTAQAVDGVAPVTIPVSRSEVAAASVTPAPPTSAVAAATVATAQAAGTTLVPVSVTVLKGATSQATGVHQVTVAVPTISGVSDPTYTDAAIQQEVASVSAYWSGQTAGAQTYQVAKIVRYGSTNHCTATSYADQWNEAAAAAGWSPGANEHLVELIPTAVDQGCPYGLGTVGATPSSGGEVYVTDLNWAALAHELGHNMSLMHANHLACATDVAAVGGVIPKSAFAGMRPGCGEQEYGDFADVMSASSTNAAGGTSSMALRRLGVLSGGDTVDVTAAGVTHQTVNPLGSGAGLRSVEVVDPRSGNAYYVENRESDGADTYGWGGHSSGPYGMTYGVRVLKASSDGGSLLLDPTPSADPFAYDANAVVAPGTTFKTAGDGVEIRVDTIAAGVASVSISVAPAGTAHWAGAGPGATGTTTTATGPATYAVGTPATITGTTTTAAAGAPATGASTAAGGPTGTVKVSLGGATATAAVDARTGSWTARLTPTTAGSGSLTAEYASATPTTYADSRSTTAVTVAARAVKTTTSVTAGPFVSGTPGVVTVDVTGATAGTVTVTLGAVTRTAAVDAKGTCVVSLTPVGNGAQGFGASYSGATAPDGDSVFAASATPVGRAVVTASTTTVLDRLRSSYAARTAAVLTGRVTTAGAGVATGSVRVSLGGVSSVVRTAADGTFSATLTPTATGLQPVSAAYLGADGFAPSTSAGATAAVVGAATAVGLPKTVSTSTGKASLLPVTVTNVGDHSAATGTVVLKVSGAEVTRTALGRGAAVLPLPAASAAGSRGIEVDYLGADGSAASSATVVTRDDARR